jgi:hypothetical protein
VEEARADGRGDVEEPGDTDETPCEGDTTGDSEASVDDAGPGEIGPEVTGTEDTPHAASQATSIRVQSALFPAGPT